MSGSNPPSAAAIARLAVSQNNLKRSVQAAFEGEHGSCLFPLFFKLLFLWHHVKMGIFLPEGIDRI